MMNFFRVRTNVFKGIIDLFSEIWKWAVIVSKSEDLGNKFSKRKLIEKASSIHKEVGGESTDPRGVREPEIKEIKKYVEPEIPVEGNLEFAKKLVELVIEEIELVKKFKDQKQSWLTFSNMPDDSIQGAPIRYYVVKNVHQKSGIIPRWTTLKEITFSI